VPTRQFATVADFVAERIPQEVGILLLTKGLVGERAELPCDYVLTRAGERPLAVLGGPAHALEACSGRAGLVVASREPWFAAQIARSFERIGIACETSDDPAGVQLAGCAKNAAALAAGIALSEGVNSAGAAAGRVYAECHAFARASGARSAPFTGLAGAGDLVATVLASQSRNRRAGELLAREATVGEIELELGQAAESLDLVPLLAGAMRARGVKAPATAALAALIEERRVDHPITVGARGPARARVA
jgi:glycerol-3-phosphate dehydrogenase (NAD(P)+)